MYMNNRIEQIYADFENNALGLDDTFRFGCRACGKCCKNRDDILLTTKDIYNIARFFGRTVQYVVERYCEVYIGGSSRIPIVRLNPVGPDRVCPLLRNRRCSVHGAKPVVCALFPLGRASLLGTENGKTIIPEDIQPTYFLQPATCGSQTRIQTVRDWLSLFGIPAEDEFYSAWTHATTLLSEYMRRLEQLLPEETMQTVWSGVFVMLYLHFDTGADLLPQFRDNFSKLMAALDGAVSASAIITRGNDDGK
jgi:Fe-S-cluster containining protein